MTIESSLENLLIYYDNLSLYYVGSVIITLLSVILAWWYNKNKVEVTNEEKPQLSTTNNSSKLDQKNESGEENDTNDDIVSKMKTGRQSLFSEEVSANMTEDQLKEEKEVEKQQLEAIFQLLQSEEDKFQVNSLEELEDQLKLYRH